MHTHELIWGDLKYGVTASGHVAGEDVSRALNMMDVTWDGVELQNQADNADLDTRRIQEQKIRKRALNAMVGSGE